MDKEGSSVEDRRLKSFLFFLGVCIVGLSVGIVIVSVKKPNEIADDSDMGGMMPYTPDLSTKDGVEDFYQLWIDEAKDDDEKADMYLRHAYGLIELSESGNEYCDEIIADAKMAYELASIDTVKEVAISLKASCGEDVSKYSSTGTASNSSGGRGEAE